jgi:hypothetical protein
MTSFALPLDLGDMDPALVTHVHIRLDMRRLLTGRSPARTAGRSGRIGDLDPAAEPSALRLGDNHLRTDP